MTCEICKRPCGHGNYLPRDRYTTTYFSLVSIDKIGDISNICIACIEAISDTIIKLAKE